MACADGHRLLASVWDNEAGRKSEQVPESLKAQPEYRQRRAEGLQTRGRALRHSRTADLWGRPVKWLSYHRGRPNTGAVETVTRRGFQISPHASQRQYVEDVGVLLVVLTRSEAQNAHAVTEGVGVSGSTRDALPGG